MNVSVISIDHYLQLLEAETDTEALRASKTHLRQILEAKLASGRIVEIFEECSPRKETIAAQLARPSVIRLKPAIRDRQISWHNIHMTEAERRKAGIYEALLNRPGSPDETMEFTIEHRIPEDGVRENHFAAQILSAGNRDVDVVVLLGDMHVLPVADRLKAQGHTVEILPELVPIKRWK